MISTAAVMRKASHSHDQGHPCQPVGRRARGPLHYRRRSDNKRGLGLAAWSCTRTASGPLELINTAGADGARSGSHQGRSPMKAGDVMTRRIVSVEPDESVVRAARLMLQNHISGLPVVDATGALAGIVTEGDFL